MNDKNNPATLPVKRTKKISESHKSARLGAVQFLYQMEQDKKPFGYALDQFIRFYLKEDDRLKKADLGLFEEIAQGGYEHQKNLDTLISEYLSNNWRLDRIGEVAIAILRAGAFELQAHLHIPYAVIINDYVNIAKAFFHEQEPNFINAVLDKIAKKLRVNHGDH